MGAMPLPPENGSKFEGRKKLWLLAGGTAAVLALAAWMVFGWYMPNTPASVWNTGVNRSGTALDGFVQSAMSTKQLAAYKTSTVTGTADAHFGGVAYSGSINTTFDSAAMNGNLSFGLQAKDGSKQAITAQLMSQVPAGKLYPDVYVQVNGLKATGLEALDPGIAAYDGQWILIGSDYLQSLGGSLTDDVASGSSQATAADVAQLVKTASGVTKDYLFTTNSDKAVFVKKAFIGKETVDGRSTYHYTVGVNAAHAKDYCVALSNALLSTPAYQHISGKTSSELGDAKKSASDQCSTDFEDMTSANDTADMWVDGHYKLIYKIRTYDDNNKNSYTEIGQNYRGGNTVSLFMNSHDAQAPSDTKLTLDANLKSNDTKLTYAIKDSGASPYDVTTAFTLTASSKAVTVTKPASATPIETLLGAAGVPVPAASSSSSVGGGSDASASAYDSAVAAAMKGGSTSVGPQDQQDNADEADIGQSNTIDQ
jgi:hypothetical protein